MKLLACAVPFFVAQMFSSPVLLAQQPAPPPTTAADAPNRDTSFIDEKGTAHVTRVVPVPQTLSPLGQQILSHPDPAQGPPQPLSERRRLTDEYTARARVEWTTICPNQLVDEKIAGVPVHIVTPQGMPERNKDKVLLNLHGG